MSDVRVVLITAPAGGAAKTIAKDLVDHQLAACVNVIRGVESVYRWEGRIEDDTEDLLMVKTTSERMDDLTARIAEIHPYSVPEVVALPVVAGSKSYLDWVLGETGGSQAGNS